MPLARKELPHAIREKLQLELVSLLFSANRSIHLERFVPAQGASPSVHLFVLGRQSQSIDADVALEIGLEQRRVARPEQLFEADAGRIFLAEDFDVELSSTQVREVLTKGGEAVPLLNAQVHKYISHYALYGCSTGVH